MQDQTNMYYFPQPVPPKKSRKKQIIIITLIAVAVCAAILAAVLLIFGERKYTVNTANMPNEIIKVSSEKKSFAVTEQNYSFLYPSTAEVSLDGENVYVYTVENGEAPYVMVYLSKETVSPDKYFKTYRKLVQATLPVTSFGTVSQVKIGDKTLYMLRAEIKDNGSTMIIDRYIEIYPDVTVQYTVKSNHAGSEDKILSDIVQSLYLKSDAYSTDKNDYIDIKSVSNSKLGMSMSFPSDMQVSELPIGLLGSGDGIRIFASYQNTDASGAAIYNADDFVNRISSVNGLLQNQLKVDDISIQNGKAEKTGNFEAYVFPVTITDGEFSGTGKIYLTNGLNIGCYILYYAVSDDTLTASAERCISSFNIENTSEKATEYKMYTDGGNAFSFLYRTGVTDSTPTDMGGIAEFKLSDNAVFNIDTFMPSAEGVTSADEYLTKFAEELKKVNPDIKYTVKNAEDAEQGRLGFKTVEISYSYGGSSRTVSLSCADCGGNIARVYYTLGDDAMREKMNTLRNDILWSFRSN